MRKLAMALMLAGLTTAGCAKISGSRFNPLNWFSRSVAVPTTLAPEGGYAALDGRGLVDQVISLEVKPTPGGAIISAVGLPPTQGYWSAELVNDTRDKPDDNGVLTYRFVVWPPLGAAPVSTQPSREVTAAAFLSNVKLEQVRRIVVQGTRSSRSSAR